jgi:hypothetical protein
MQWGMMDSVKLFGVGLGFCIAAAAVNVGSPVFFTKQHLDSWHEHLVSSGFLPSPIEGQKENVRSPYNHVSQWGY